MITIKKESSADWNHFGQIRPQLGLIFYDICLWLEKRGYDLITITSIIRPKTHDSGIHELGRAMDIRPTFPDGVGDELMDYINKKYPYPGGQYQTIIRHTTDVYEDEGKHYHLQCGVANG